MEEDIKRVEAYIEKLKNDDLEMSNLEEILLDSSIENIFKKLENSSKMYDIKAHLN